MRTIRTDDAPAPVKGAPYSQAVVAGPGEMVFVSGQLGIDPRTGTLVSEAVREQTAMVLRNLVTILAAAGARIEDVTKATVYLTDLAGDFAAMNDVYAEVFAGHVPARVTVGVAALPLGARVEIDATAVIHPR